MPSITLYAQVHQPYRLSRFRVFDIGGDGGPFDDALNAAVVRRVAAKCYLPATRLLTRLVRETDGEFRLALSLTGTLLEQLKAHAPEALEAFQSLVATGHVELLGETYHHSLSALKDHDEFRAQAGLHRAALERHFGAAPRVFRNTELIYWDGLAPAIADMGFEGVLMEGADHVLRGRSPNHAYTAAGVPGLRLLPRNYSLSDDIGFRFSNRDWPAWPLRAETYAEWLHAGGGDSVHLFLDYETFGEHQWEETGIFGFLARLPHECRTRGMPFATPSELLDRPTMGALSVDRPTSWADTERDVSAWLGNPLQDAAHDRLYALRGAALAAGGEALDTWRRLTTSDHVYYMCTKWFADGDVHTYFSPFETPYDAFISYMNALGHLELMLGRPADAPLARAAA